MFFALISFLFALVSSEGVSLKIDGYNEDCVYAQAQYRGEKIAFYYSVLSAANPENYDISVEVHNSKNEVILSTDKEGTGDYVFAAAALGEYAFCFLNHESFQKMVYVDVTAESDTSSHQGNLGSEYVKTPAASGDQAAKQELKETSLKVNDLVLSLEAKLDTLHKQMMYIKTRETRSISTVKSTQSRIRWFTFLESSLMIGISAAQVFLIRAFFSRPGSMSRI